MLSQRCISTGLVLSSTLCTPLIAQEQQEPDGNVDNSVENIVVYAQKRAQDIAEIAIPVTVVDGLTLRELQLKDTTQISSLIPNFKITNNAGEGTPPAFNIRGIGMIDYNTSSVSPISIYADGVVGGSANNLSANLFDLEQIDVLRGPQGTLFGRNTTGGAVLMRSRMPEGEFSGYLTAGVAQYSTSMVEGAVNIPTSANVNSRFAFNYDNYDFSTDNLFPGAPDGGMRQLNLRWITTAEFEDVRIMAKVHTDNWSGSPKPIESLGTINLQTGEACEPGELGALKCVNLSGFNKGTDEFFDTFADTADKVHDTDAWGAAVRVEWDINDKMMLTSITGLRDLERLHTFDSDGPSELIEGTMDTENDLFTQEFNLSYQGEKSYWIAGIYYLSEDLKQLNSLDIYRELRNDPTFGAFAAETFYDTDIETDAIAVFGQVDYQLDDMFTITAGLRYTDETTEWQSIAALDTAAGFIPEFWNLSGEVEDDELSGKLSLVQKISNEVSFYYSYSRGYKSGGYNGAYVATPEVAAASEYRPETVDAYEMGQRYVFMEGRARTDVSVFYYDFKDQQIFVALNSESPFGVLTNAGDSTIFGLESEFKYSDDKNWVFILNVGYIPEAETGNFERAGVVVQETRLPFTSEWNIGGRAQWQDQIGAGQLKAELGFDYQSEFYFDQNENPYTEQKGYSVWNGRIGYSLPSGLSFGLWGKNLFNKEYAELRFDSSAIQAVTELKGERRQIGVDVTYEF